MIVRDDLPETPDWHVDPRSNPFDEPEAPIVVPANIELGGRAD